MPPVSTGTLVYRQPLWKRGVQLAAGVLMLALCVTILLIPNAPITLRILGALGLLLFGYFFVIALTKQRTVLIASQEGIIPSLLNKKYRTLISWGDIDRIDIASQQVNNGPKYHYLTFTFKRPEAFESSFLAQANKFAASTMSDGAVAGLYIPALMLPVSPERAIEQLSALRPQGA